MHIQSTEPSRPTSAAVCVSPTSGVVLERERHGGIVSRLAPGGNAVAVGELDGRVALVTGAGTGIGHAIARRLGRAGAHVVANYHGSADEAERLAAELSDCCARSIAVQADVSKRDEVERMVEQAVGELGPVSVLVNNAGIEKPAPVLDIAEEDWDAVLAVNLTGAFLCLQACGRVMRDAAAARS